MRYVKNTAYRMARKFLKFQREDRREPRDSLVSRIVRATLRRLTVIVRNPIYQAFLRPSSMLCTTSHRFSLCHSALSQAGPDGDTGNCRRPVWDFYNVVVYVPLVLKTAIPDVDHLFPSAMMVINVLRFFRSSLLSWYWAWRCGNSNVCVELLCRAILMTTDNIDLKPRSFQTHISIAKRDIVSCSDFVDTTHDRRAICHDSSFYV